MASSSSSSSSWVYSIRTSMANDPAKLWFDDRVQTHGFDFLDDYLRNILAQAKPQPIIELVKTPSRKKNLGKKPRSVAASASKLNSVISLSLDDEYDQSKENSAPVNTFHQALMEARNNAIHISTTDAEPPMSKPKAVSSEPELVPNYTTPESQVEEALNVSSQPTDLSIIAEGDEFAEQNGRLAPSVEPPKEPSPAPILTETVPETHPMDDEPAVTISPIDEPPTENESQATLLATQSSDTQIVTLSNKTLPTRTPFKTTIPLDEIPGTGLMRKGSAPQLQGFPSNTNPPLTLPKRSSWLVKAKEAQQLKAVEAKRTSTLPQGAESSDRMTMAVPSSSRTKRKSSDMQGPVVTEEPTDRHSKVLKVVEEDVWSNALRAPPVSMSLPDEDDNGTFQFKRAADAFRKPKGTGKSMGPSAAALAEARAKAEARIAERALEHGVECPLPVQELEPEFAAEAAPHLQETEMAEPPTSLSAASTRSLDADKRLSVSELSTGCDSMAKEKERVFQPLTAAGPSRNTSDVGAPKDVITYNAPITVDPVSPPKSRHSKPSLSLLSKPVFMKPPPKVFVPPPQPKSPKMAATNLGLSPSFHQAGVQLSSQSSITSTVSESVFENSGKPAWMPSTQDSQYANGIDYETRTQDQEMRGVNDLEDDDSWHDGDKLGELNHIWTALEEKDDEMTWSTIPTQTHTSSTQNQSNKLLSSIAKPATPMESTLPAESEDNAADQGMDMEIDDSDLEELELVPGQMTVGLVKKSSQQEERESLYSSESSQGGILHQASKFMNSVLGTSKKGKTPDPVKSIQLAAAAAKKQKEEEDKKAAKVKEMEFRRQQLALKKVDEEKARALEEEKRVKEEAEKKRKEREDNTDKLPLKASTAKKIPEPKAVPSSSQETQPASVTRAKANPTKSILKPAAEAPAPPKPVAGPSQPKSNKAITIATPAKSKGKVPAKDYDDEQPSRLVRDDMAARAREQLFPSPPVKSESILLPEIDSEYSDSDDEDRKKNFDPPEWAQSPNLRNTLEALSTVNPDNIFGAVQPLQMDDLFRNRRSKFRARTSSANWSGNDGLSKGEEEEYARRMGFN